jgi:leucyl-tRNA synthetase
VACCSSTAFEHGDWTTRLKDTQLSPADIKLRRKTHQTILKVQSDIERFALNTAIAALMEHVMHFKSG